MQIVPVDEVALHGSHVASRDLFFVGCSNLVVLMNHAARVVDCEDLGGMGNECL